MKNEDCILFLDSGVGGLGILFETQKILKNQNFVYVADFLNSPYGQKSKKEIEKAVLSVINKFCEQFSVKCVVLACNTATAVTSKTLRERFKDLEVIGCEPAILPALRQNYKHILVLCTCATKKFNKLLKEYKRSEKLIFFCPRKLASLVDENFCNLKILNTYVSKLLRKFKGKVDAVVLGCTHYVFLKEQIQTVLNVPVFDGNQAIAKQIFKKVGGFSSKNPKTIFVSTDVQKQKFLEYAKNFVLKDLKKE